jgi:23S rRNA (uracil1939-C5)-methyltransferase
MTDRVKKPAPLIIEQLEITGVATEGKAIGRHEGQVVFVVGAVPGDVVDVRVVRRKSKFLVAVVVRVVTPSAHRVQPFCPHFGSCGGCKWQHVDYAQQLVYKQQQVVDNLERIGGLELPPVTPILPSPRTTHYRNKLEFAFSSHRWLTEEEIDRIGRKVEPDGAPNRAERNALGFHVPRRFDRVLDIRECHLQPDPSDSIRNFVREQALAMGLSFYNVREHHGFLRNLMVRTTTTGECMVLLSVGHENVEAREKLLGALVEQFPQLTSVQWTVNPKRNDTIFDLDIHLFHGRDHIVQELPDGPGGRPLKFRIGPKSFFQTNPEQTVAMYRRVRELAGLTGQENVYDLYCGAGSITLFLAGMARQVVGVELVPESVIDARANAELNGVTNVSFVSGDMKRTMDAAFVRQYGRPDVVVTDPPRAGMDEPVVRHLLELEPDRIVYVSCNPATQARDLAILNDRYRIDHVQPVDMFPHTYHVENVVRLVKR